MNKKVQFLILAALLILINIGNVSAQTTTASISGTVTDERQAVVPAATVTARNTDTGLSRKIKPTAKVGIILSTCQSAHMK